VRGFFGSRFEPAAQAFATQERSKIGFPHARKALKANNQFFREFYGKEYVDANYG
jgi:hypothetical protein